MQNDIWELIRSRKSIRRFKAEKPEPRLLQQVLGFFMDLLFRSPIQNGGR